MYLMIVTGASARPRLISARLLDGAITSATVGLLMTSRPPTGWADDSANGLLNDFPAVPLISLVRPAPESGVAPTSPAISEPPQPPRDDAAISAQAASAFDNRTMVRANLVAFQLLGNSGSITFSKSAIDTPPSRVPLMKNVGVELIVNFSLARLRMAEIWSSSF